MDLRNLHAFWLFYLTARERSFTKAAELANMSQPPLSMQIRKLEVLLGKDLFDRSLKRVTLTKEGELIYPIIESFLEKTDIFFFDVQDALLGKHQKIVIGAFSWASSLVVPRIINLLRGKLPDTQFDFLTIESFRVQHLLRDSKVDLAYAYSETGKDPSLFVETVAWIESVCLLPPAHPLAKLSEIKLSDLEGQTCICICPEVSPELFSLMQRLSVDKGFKIRSKKSIRCFHDQAIRVGMGEGIALVASPTVSLLPSYLRTVKILDMPKLRLRRICRQEFNKVGISFLAQFERQVLSSLPGISFQP